MSEAHDVTRQFERAVGEYVGARHVVAVNSCTMAITLALAWMKHRKPFNPAPSAVWMPKLSYVGVPAAVLHAGFEPMWVDLDWQGEYQFLPFPVWDSARRFTSGMFRPGSMQCVSFHASKILGDSQGGAILHDNDDADTWLRRARFDGRTEGADPHSDSVQWPSWHCYMSPDVAARLLWRLSVLPRHNAVLPRSNYPDLSQLEAFK
jgi:dTDP-4-amino-4,6-dideoxygalactose transaminase